jgi:acid phosphatase (class A)
MVCNVHWMSDTEAGMAVGAAAFAQLQNNALYQATMRAARLELDAKTLAKPNPQACAEEAEILSVGR